MQQIRFWLAVGLGAFLALFSFQNMALVEVKVLFWTFETSRFFVIAASFLIGVAIGWIVKSLQRARRRDSDARPPKTETLI